MAYRNAVTDCADQCRACSQTCQETLFKHCLIMGGEHMRAAHVTLMMDCIQICQTAADFMARESPLHTSVCAACADICLACAKSCEDVGGDVMRHCAEICRRCGTACQAMGMMKQAA